MTNKKFINLELKLKPKLNRHSDECLVKISYQNTQGVRRSKSQTESEQNCFLKTKRPDFSSPCLLFVIRLWTCLLSWVQTTYKSVCVNLFSAIRTQNEIAEIRPDFTSFGRDSLGFYKISEKFSRNGFFLKFHPRISTEFRTKRDLFQVKWMSIHPRKK